MIVKKNNRGYSSNSKYVQGKGFIDSLSSSLRSIGSYVSQNKDLIAKPLLGAVGNVAALGLMEGSKAVINRYINKTNTKKGPVSNITEPKLDAKSNEILQSIINRTSSEIPLTNIIGSGIKQF